MASEAHYLTCRYSPHVTCPRAGAGGRQAGVLIEPRHTPGQETAGRPDTDGTRVSKVRSENFPDFHSVTSWGHVDGQPAHPHGAERRGGPGRKGLARGQRRPRMGLGAEEQHQAPRAPRRLSCQLGGGEWGRLVNTPTDVTDNHRM